MSAPVNLSRAARQQLESLKAAGLTHLPRPLGNMQITIERPADLPPPAAPKAAETSRPEKAPPARSSAAAVTQSAAGSESSTVGQGSANVGFAALQLTPPNLVRSELSREERVAQLDALAEKVRACTRCPELAATRRQTVFGVGNPEAKIMYLGEAPGADEDRQGEPFVGAAGQLLNRIIAACGLKREEIYICNVLRCRPPMNRNPSLVEANNCREYLDGQIRIVDPDYIVCWGSVAAQNLLGVTTPVGKMRQRFYQYGRAKVAVTYHPSYLLRNPGAKKDVWEDMKWIMRDMGVHL